MSLGRWIRTLRRDPLKRTAAILAVATVVVMVLIAGQPSFTNASRPPRWGSAILSLEFVRNVGDVDLILSEAPSPDREAMRIKTYIDFALILCYVSLGVALSALLARAGGWKQTAAIAATICIAAAGVFDVFENRAILRVLDTPLKQTTEVMLNAIRGPAIAKWWLVAATVLLLATHFVKTSKKA